MENAKILIVEDDADIVELLTYNLEKEGYLLESAPNGLLGYEKLASFQPDLILLDIMMPEMDGIELCNKIRSQPEYNEILIAFLTARGESFTQVTALDAGGDDFITKPIKPSVLKSRIKALLRRSTRHRQDVDSALTFGELEIDADSFTVSVGQTKLDLTKKEFELLRLLTSRPGKVFKRETILSKVWGNEVVVGDRTIDVHVRKLREKIGSHYIKTLKGVGYKFVF
jgi:two-component system alkaline phosphatase synthesis response regulator PhoP